MARDLKKDAEPHAPMGDAFERAAATAEAVADELREGGEPGDGAADAAKEASAAPAPTNADVIGVGLTMLRAAPFFARRFPRAAACLSDEVIAENAEAVGAVMDKYGWNFGGLDAWAVELRAAVAVGSMAFALSDALAADVQAAKEAAAKDVTHQDPPTKADGSEAPSTSTSTADAMGWAR